MILKGSNNASFTLYSSLCQQQHARNKPMKHWWLPITYIVRCYILAITLQHMKHIVTATRSHKILINIKSFSYFAHRRVLKPFLIDQSIENFTIFPAALSCEPDVLKVLCRLMIGDKKRKRIGEKIQSSPDIFLN